MWPRRAPERAGCRGFGVQAIAPWLLERRISNCRAPSERHGSNELRRRRPERKSTAWRNEDSGPPAPDLRHAAQPSALQVSFNREGARDAKPGPASSKVKPRRWAAMTDGGLTLLLAGPTSCSSRLSG